MEHIQRIKCGNGNCYIVSKGDNAILVDTCRPKYRKKILDACKAYNIRLLVLTHGHMDHIQNAAFLAKELNIPIAIHKADEELIKDNMAQGLEAKTLLGKLVLWISKKGFEMDEIAEFSPTCYLEEGDCLTEYGISAKIISVPGHTNGSIAIDVNAKDLIVGDALMNMFYPTISMLYHNREEMLKSAKKISQLGNRTIYFGHGKPVTNRSWVRNNTLSHRDMV